VGGHKITTFLKIYKYTCNLATVGDNFCMSRTANRRPLTGGNRKQAERDRKMLISVTIDPGMKLRSMRSGCMKKNQEVN
jgi:hypothetical protein